MLAKPTFHRKSMPTALGATPSRLPSRWKSCCFVAIRKSWTPTSRTDDPGRFARSRMLGANFGLTPGKYQSAEADVTGAISRVATSHIDRIRPNPSKLLQRGVILTGHTTSMPDMRKVIDLPPVENGNPRKLEAATHPPRYGGIPSRGRRLPPSDVLDFSRPAACGRRACSRSDS